jgi:hypothetical protein
MIHKSNKQLIIKFTTIFLLSSLLISCGGGSSTAAISTPPTVTLTSSHATVTENSATEVTITALASTTSTSNIIVNLASTGTATSGTDYSALASSITIGAGSTSGFKKFTVTNDSSTEGNETIIVSIDSVTGGSATESGTQSSTITIVDDESTPSITLTSSVTTLAENSGTTVTLTATSSVSSSSNITVTLATSGLATDGTDYSSLNGTTITIAAGSTTGTKTFTMTDDSVYEGSENIDISISTVSTGAYENGSQSVDFTITENESAPTVTLAASASSLAENSGTTITLTATSSIASSSDITVTLAATGTATSGTDYSVINATTITISAGATTGTKTFTVSDDSIYEGNETVIAAISAVSGSSALESGTQAVTITITENESAPTVTLATSATSIAENSSDTITLTATASQIADEDITVTLATTGTGTSGTDYSAVNATTITISAGATTGTKTFTITDDSVSEGSETAIVAISGVSGGGASESGTQSVTVTISDNDSPQITLASSVSTLSENSSTTVTLTATSSMTSTSAITVTLATAGTATDGTDYSAVNGTTITIAAGSTTGTKTFTMTNDSDSESNETIITSISGVSGGNAAESGTQSVTFTIVDDESTPVITLAISATSLAENSGTTVTLTATSSSTSSSNIVVTLATSGTGTDGTDYSAVNGTTITIAAGATTGTKTFTITDDSVYEGNETAIVAISGVSGGSAVESGTQSVTLTITENDSAPTITLATSSTSLAENSGTTVTLTATTSTTSSLDIVVTLGVTGTGTEGTDYSAIDETITISAGSSTGTKTFTLTDDAIYEGDETVIVAIASVTNASENGTQSVTTTISENESSPTVQISSSASSVYDNGMSLTITATSSQVADEAITAVIGTSGTSTEGTDYATVANITIAAGSTTGTATFDPTADTVHENSETAIITITSVSGADSAKGTTVAVTITINEYNLNTGTTLTYNESNANTMKETTEFKNFNYGNDANNFPNPLEVINAHKAYGYGLTGDGTIIAVMDNGINVNHVEFDQKTITSFGTIGAATNTNYHGTFVMGVAAGEDDGVNSTQGVAPEADLHVSDFWNKGSYTNHPDHWAAATAHASTAVAQNNSWGVDYQVDSMKSWISSNNTTNALGISTAFNALSSFTATEASVNAYATALNNFQAHGVVVTALSNDSGFTDADISAGLPEFFPNLKEAWIAAVNVEITGTIANPSYAVQSAPCGQTGAYCLGADGTKVSNAGYASNTGYKTQWTGTSFVAPQISGAVAILAEAFPNMTPDQWQDRLLASANNTFFNHDAVVTYGNGVTHGYDDEYGHGIMDIHAALNPITSSSDNRSTRVFTGGSLDDRSTSHTLGESRFISSGSFGDSLFRGLSGQVGYLYDDLDGGFAYDYNSHIDLSSTIAPSVNLSSEMSKMSLPVVNTSNSSWKNNFNQVVGGITNSDKTTSALVSIGSSSIPVQSFFDSNMDSSTNLSDFQTPYLTPNEGGVGVGASYSLPAARILLGATLPVDNVNRQTNGINKSLSGSIEFGSPSAQSLTLIAGITQEDGMLLGSKGSAAFSIEDAKSNTSYTGIKVQKKFGDIFSLEGVATIASSSMNDSSNMIAMASNLKSSSAALIGNFRNLSKDDHLSIYVSQPNRINSGSMSFKTAGLASSDRTITQSLRNINLESSSRQIDFGLSYRKEINKDLDLSLKHMLTKNLNHTSSSNRLHSSYIGLGYKDIKLGVSSNPGGSLIESKFTFSSTF